MRSLLLAGTSLLFLAVAGCALPVDRGRDASLEDTYWKLTRLGNEPVTMTDGQREPYLVFHGKTGRLAGFGGCNRLLGTYKLNEGTLSLSPIASTRMACAEGSETEAKFLAALERVHFWKIVGQHLELFDSARAFLARFEARELN